MLSVSIFLLFLFTLPCSLFAGRIQHPNLTQSALSKQRAQEVRDVFVGAYGDYKTYAWGHDELSPLTKGYRDSRNGWGATIVDSLDTLLVMNLTDLFEEAVAFVATVDFTRSASKVSVFETIIRYVGGLLSAYELTDGRHPVLLQQAEALGHKLVHAWSDSRGDMPWTYLYFENETPEREPISVATAGSNLLEFSKLSKFSGNTTFLRLAERSMGAVLGTNQALPGLFGQIFDPQTNGVIEDKMSWGPNSDSFYEYLLKYPHLTGNANKMYLDTWLAAVDSSIQHLLFKSTAGNWTYLSDLSPTKGYDFTFGHLACFVGGNWLLGGRLTDNLTIYQHGVALVDSCANAYAASPLGIGPEMWHYIPQGRNDVSQNAPAQYQSHGFWATDTRFILRPEVVESMFYAYRITGNPKYQDMLYDVFQAVKTHCKAPAGYASLARMDVYSPTLVNELETFFFAELLKYFYLAFADPDVVHLDKFTLTTEAHPFYLDVPVFEYIGGRPEDFPDWRDVEREPDASVVVGADRGCGWSSEGISMSYLLMAIDLYVPVLESCRAAN